MKKILETFLGILTAMGGFVEIGEVTFTVNAGSKFDYRLLWVMVLGTIGIMVFCEMAGRIAAVRKLPVFQIVRERTGFSLSLLTLVSASAVCLLTCAAEIGAIAMIWQLLSGWPYRVLILLALAFLLLSVWFLSFRWIERVFGLGGLLLVVYIVTALKLAPDWGTVAAGLVPTLPDRASGQLTVYAFFAVALLSSIMLPYETYFYASGGIEDKWKPSDITLNRLIVLIGFTLGALLAVSLLVVGSEFFGAREIEIARPGSAALAPAWQFGQHGLLIALLGMFFAFAGAAIETALSAAYNLAQFFGWPWGKHRAPAQAPRFALCWIVVFVLAALVVSTGVDPVEVVEYSIVFSIVILPLTYLPLMLVAGDKRVMGQHVNGPLAATLGWGYFVIITLAAIAAIPLMILTHGGEG